MFKTVYALRWAQRFLWWSVNKAPEESPHCYNDFGMILFNTNLPSEFLSPPLLTRLKSSMSFPSSLFAPYVPTVSLLDTVKFIFFGEGHELWSPSPLYFLYPVTSCLPVNKKSALDFVLSEISTLSLKSVLFSYLRPGLLVGDFP
jgi:hypothetical protein